MEKIPVKGTGFSPVTVKHFKTFDEFHKWADTIFDGSKKELEEVYYKYHSRPETKGGGK